VLASFPCRLPSFSFTFSLNCASKPVYRLYFVGSLPRRVGSSLVKYNYNVKPSIHVSPFNEIQSCAK